LKYRVLGKTGLKVSILGFGGIPIRRVSEREAVAVVNRALDLGVNVIHTSVTYGDSANKIGLVMKERRDDCFLAVKIGGRTKVEAEDRLKRSLEALHTSHIEIAELPINAFEFPTVMAPNGAYKAFERAKDDGVIDFIGITSHDVNFLIDVVPTKSFSNLIAPFNFVATAGREKLLSLAAEFNMGVIAMKTLGKGGLSNVSQALRYVWNQDIDTAIVGMNKKTEVEQNVATAEDLHPLTEEEKQSLQQKAAEIIKANRLSSSGAVI
jgi:predicted aldo/keto reductase-like oxidoreductase